MTTRQHSSLAALLLVTAFAGAATTTATATAASLGYVCSSSTKTIDDASYSGPWPDNWDVTVETCAARSGATVYAYSDIRWDGPHYGSTDAVIFDGAKVRVQISQSREGTDPVVAEQDFSLKSRLEKSTSNGDHDGHWRTPVISHRAGRGAYGNSVIFLDWHKDGHGYQAHDYKGSPTV
ncbi:hypothetical protein [Streptomyces sp. NPDC001546]|uniref:hypothetical protein n=1 Tax=Streptomyces sp. NPDC001546 TaxID=3364585 RepID=UPI0036754DA4